MFFRDNITRGSGLNRVPLPRISWHDSNRPNNRSLRTCRRDSYRRNLLFADGAVMEWAFDTVVDRTPNPTGRAEAAHPVDVGHPPHRPAGADLSPRQAVVIERPRWNLTLFKVHFGLLTLNGYTKPGPCECWSSLARHRVFA